MLEADTKLLNRFIATFELHDDICWNTIQPRPGDWPVEHAVPRSALSVLQVSGRLPTLFETLALSYRWPEVELGAIRLLPNFPAADLQPLADSMFADPVMNNTLHDEKLVRFGLSRQNYDPICFDLKRMSHGDCPIIRLEHEAILTNDRIGESDKLFDSFRDFVVDTIESCK